MATKNIALALKIQADMNQAIADMSRLSRGVAGTSQAADTLSGSARSAASALGGLSGSAAGAAGGFGRASAGLESLGGQLNRNQTLITRFAAAWFSLSSLSSLIGLVDEYGQMASRIKMATASTDEYEMVQARLLETANRTYRPLAEAQEVYIRTADALRSMGYNTEQALDVSDSLSYLFVTNAASADKASAAINAFGKALAKGKIEALAWQTLMAAMPTLAQKIADSTEQPIEKIRQLGAEGKLALTDLTEALRKSVEENGTAADLMPTAVKDALTTLRTSLQAYLGEANKGAGVTAAMAKAIGFLANNIDMLVKGGLIVAVAALSRFAVSTAAAGIAALQTAAAQATATKAALAAAKAELVVAENIAARAAVQVDAAIAQAALAQAEVRAAQAAVVQAQAITNQTARTAALTAATAQLTAAKIAAAASEARATAARNIHTAALGNQAASLLRQTNAAKTAAAATGILTTAGRGLLTVFGGPVGLAVTVATVTAGWLLFRDNAKAAESGLAELGLTTEQAIEKLNKLGEAQSAAALAKLANETDAASETARKMAIDLAHDLSTSLRGRLFSEKFKGDAQAAMQYVRDQIAGAARGIAPDFKAMADAIKNTTDLTEEQRRTWLINIGALEDAGEKSRKLSQRYDAVSNSADNAAVSVDGLTAKMREQADADAWDDIKKTAEQIAALKDPSALGKFDRTVAPEWMGKGISPEVIEAQRQYLKLLDATNAAKKKAPREKADPYEQRSIALGAELMQAQQKLANAQAGVDDATRKATDALAVWLATGKDAQKLSASQKDALGQQADAVDAATRAYKELADAQKRAKEIADGMQGVEIELLKLKGNSSEAARREFTKQYQELIEKIQAEIAAGNTGMQVHLNAVLELQDLSAAKTQLDDVLARIEKIRDAQGRDENTLQTQIEAGVLTEIEGRDHLLDIHRKTAAELERIRPLLVELSQMPGQVGEDARAALQKLDDQARQLRSTVGALQGALKDGLTSGITEALTGLAKGTMDLKEAVAALGEAVLDAMLKIAAEQIAESAVNGIMGMVGGLFGGGASAAANAAAGAGAASGASDAAASTALSTAGTTLTASGGMLDTAAMGLDASAMGLDTAAMGLDTSAIGLDTAAFGLEGAGFALDAAAIALEAAAGSSAIGGAAGAAVASGGLIGGFSPNDHADNIPAWLTAGEFVTRKPVMRQQGALSFMRSFNRLGMPAIEAWAKRLRLPGYAGGGIVLPAPAPAVDTAALARGWQPAEVQAGAGATTVDNKVVINLVDDPNRVYDMLKTRQGADVFAGVLSRDPARFRSVLGI